jgi:predicted CoA-substrate-specific enzyme activase
MVYIGLDIGSVSVNAVLMGDDGRILEDHYARTRGQPVEAVRRVLADMLARTPAAVGGGVAVTGSGGALVSRILGCPFVNEIIAQSKATARLHGDVRTVIEIGGEDSKLILLERDDHSGQLRLGDFATNTLCAAGTGSFLDQQASRLGFTIEQFGEQALRSTNPPRIAGRCSVFAKTDMIHLQQEATPAYDIVAGLCQALARNFMSNIAKGKQLVRPIAFHGGVAANQGMVRAFQHVLGLAEGELLVPEHFASMGAIGAVLMAIEAGEFVGVPDLGVIDKYLAHKAARHEALELLVDDGHVVETNAQPPAPGGRADAYVGVDVGSISTNVVVLSGDGKVLARRYLMTAGRPIEAVVRGLKEVGDEVGGHVVVKGCGTTGSGRYLTGDFIGADVIKNEITAHARGAAWTDPAVDTIFEIGGQDSKYIRLDNGVVVDFAMNKVCAAGTGSFLEEQAERLGIQIVEEFGSLALRSRAPAQLGERCTVFMESDLNHHQQQGVAKEDLVAGLAYSIVHNYLRRVVEDRRVGDRIFFQGGVAGNRGVVAAFERVTGKKITVPPHHDVIGAIGVALIARDRCAGPSVFKGFDLTERRYTVEPFDCQDCPNLCEVRRVTVAGERPLHYGSRCGKYDEERAAGLGQHLPRLFDERRRLLEQSYDKDKPDRPIGKTVGIPRISHYFDLFPLFKAFFTELGCQVVTSGTTNRRLIRAGLEHVVAETCFPIKAAHGHVVELIRRGADFVFLPAIVDMPPLAEGVQGAFNCPYIQSIPYLMNAALELDRLHAEVLCPVIHMERGEKEVGRVLQKLAARLGAARGRARKAIEAAWAAQHRFHAAIEQRGRDVLAGLGADNTAVVIVGRSYNVCDDGLNLHLPDKLRDLGVLAIPPDFVALDRGGVGRDYPNMYWRCGQRIVGLARRIAADPRLHAVYVTNFGCGPDSFITKYFAREMGDKPFLTIEVDEHSADVGAITRCEAFLDSIRGVAAAPPPPAAMKPPSAGRRGRRSGGVVYVPFMDDHARVIAAAMRCHGLRAVALPPSDAESVDIGRQYTSGKECFPCIVTTGDIVKATRSPDFDPAASAFFMPTAHGPCRFGQYCKFHRMVLDDLGLSAVPIIELDQNSTENFFDGLGNLGTRFRKIAWSGCVLIDLLQKACRQVRPYERSRGECGGLYRRFLDRIEQAVQRGEDLRPLAKEIASSFGHVSLDGHRPKPRIGVIGELYVRCNPQCNNQICRKLEALGAEVALPALEEWIDYIGWERKVSSLARRDYAAYLTEIASSLVQEWEVRRLTRPFRRVVGDFLYESSTRRLIELARPYLDSAIRGESVLSMGRAVEYAHHGFDGLVSLIPFNCMPGAIVETLLERYRRSHPNMPILKMAYDGLTHIGEDTRIEAFMHQARQHAERSGAVAAPSWEVRRDTRGKQAVAAIPECSRSMCPSGPGPAAAAKRSTSLPSPARSADLLLELVVLSRQSDAGIDPVGCPAPGCCDGVVGQGDDVQDR